MNILISQEIALLIKDLLINVEGSHMTMQYLDRRINEAYKSRRNRKQRKYSKKRKLKTIEDDLSDIF